VKNQSIMCFLTYFLPYAIDFSHFYMYNLTDMCDIFIIFVI